ncbi:hypothetical protein MLD38_000679 [Melastoma candidum]|uniref:Uncharacterized protein n=1 Tax=Melastoma candidum TaxID=119954 RepID=A0ACB9SCF7_9MYRT|nr:hypothetical protein MLD38_000679 [Melastoma candidum]
MVVVCEGYYCRVLAVDEDVANLELIRDALHSYDCGYDVTICSNQIQALHMLHRHKVEIDLIMATINHDTGLMFLELIKHMTDAPVLAMSTVWSDGLISKATRGGVFFILEKPIDECNLHWVFVEFPRAYFISLDEKRKRSAS